MFLLVTMAGVLGPASRNLRQTYLYFGWLTLFIYLASPTGYLIDIQTAYMLKNQLHATATQVSIFRLLTAVPVYFAFAFGLVRDHWNPFGLRDRGLFLIFAPATAVVLFALAASGLSYTGLLAGMFLVFLMSRFTTAAYQGLIALVGQEKLMSGRLAALWNIFWYVPIIAGALASGYISENLPPKLTFTLVALVTCGIAALGFWKPRSVFSHAYSKPQAVSTDFAGSVRRLLRHRAIYPAVLIMFLWNFAPGAQTPLQFYLTDKLRASDAVYSYFNAIFTASFIPMLFVYGLLCKKLPLRKLLWWGTIIAIPQMVPLALIHNANLALVLAVPIGMMGGIATAAYFDLAMRACPPGLQGTLMMLVDGAYYLAQRGGDLLGSRIYTGNPAHGFLYCVIATTIVYALILPLIRLVPRELIATSDDEPNPELGELVPEIAGD